MVWEEFWYSTFAAVGAFSWTEILVLQPELVHVIRHWRVFGKETNAESSRLRWRSSQLGPKHQLLQWVQPILLNLVWHCLIRCDGLIPESRPPSSCSCPWVWKCCSEAFFWWSLLQIVLTLVALEDSVSLIATNWWFLNLFLTSYSEDVRHLWHLTYTLVLFWVVKDTFCFLFGYFLDLASQTRITVECFH